MKTIHLRKLNAIMEVKSRTLFSKNLIIMPAFSLVFTWLLKMIYTNMYPDLDFGSYALSIGLLMNTSMTGIYCVAASLAEEKEKNTLRTLMTSSVNGLEFFIGSLLPALLLLMIVNVLCVFLAGVSFTPGGWIGFLFVTAVSSLISCITGMIFGIFAPNQMTAGTLTTPLLLVLMLIPMLSQMNDTLDTISGYLFTGVLYEALGNLNKGQPPITMKGTLVLILEALISALLFLILYRKNGFESN